MLKCLWYGGEIATFDIRWHSGAGAFVTAATAFALLPLFLLSSISEFFALVGCLVAYLTFFSIFGFILRGVMEAAGYVFALQPGWTDTASDVFLDWSWGILVLGMCGYPCVWWWYGRKDRRFLKRESGDFASGSTVSREEISKVFLKLKQERGRMRFLDLLERNVSEVRGDWPAESKAGLRNKPDHERLSNLDRGWRANEELREPPESES